MAGPQPERPTNEDAPGEESRASFAADDSAGRSPLMRRASHEVGRRPRGLMTTARSILKGPRRMLGGRGNGGPDAERAQLLKGHRWFSPGSADLQQPQASYSTLLAEGEDEAIAIDDDAEQMFLSQSDARSAPSDTSDGDSRRDQRRGIEMQPLASRPQDLGAPTVIPPPPPVSLRSSPSVPFVESRIPPPVLTHPVAGALSPRVLPEDADVLPDSPSEQPAYPTANSPPVMTDVSAFYRFSALLGFWRRARPSTDFALPPSPPPEEATDSPRGEEQISAAPPEYHLNPMADQRPLFFQSDDPTSPREPPTAPTDQPYDSALPEEHPPRLQSTTRWGIPLASHFSNMISRWRGFSRAASAPPEGSETVDTELQAASAQQAQEEWRGERGEGAQPQAARVSWVSSLRARMRGLMEALRERREALASRAGSYFHEFSVASIFAANNTAADADAGPADDPTYQQLLLIGGFFLGPFLFALGAFFLLLTPRNFKKTRRWGTVNLVLAVLSIIPAMTLSPLPEPVLLAERVETFGPASHIIPTPTTFTVIAKPTEARVPMPRALINALQVSGPTIHGE